ncbi:hypothetical protein Bbelb_095910 [Branchiostoma belcheri]|nr:hypothetical protein Bbelb_095910 [Branchiostoma belcheri]
MLPWSTQVPGQNVTSKFWIQPGIPGQDSMREFPSRILARIPYWNSHPEGPEEPSWGLVVWWVGAKVNSHPISKECEKRVWRPPPSEGSVTLGERKGFYCVDSLEFILIRKTGQHQSWVAMATWMSDKRIRQECVKLKGMAVRNIS